MGGRSRKSWHKESAAFKAGLSDGLGRPGQDVPGGRGREDHGAPAGPAAIDDAFAREARRRDDAEARHEAELRRRACESKNRYPDRHEAELRARDCEAHGSPKLHAYRCPYCGGWHLTHKPPIDHKPLRP